MFEETDLQSEIDETNLLRELKIAREYRCAACDGAICGHEALMSLVMGFKNAPRCWHCLSAALAYEREALRDHLFGVIERRSCYYQGWLWSNQEEGFELSARPGCLWQTRCADSGSERQTISPAVQDGTLMYDNASQHDAEWDAGDMGCGDLVLELRIRLQSLEPGQILRILANDGGAREDLPAWCRMTGNTLVYSDHPVYLIKRKAT